MSVDEYTGDYSPGGLPAVDNPALQIRSDQLMSDSSIEIGGTGEHPTVSSESAAVQELERRLREQTDQNAELDTEVRYLLQELTIKQEYTEHLEHELGVMYAVATEFSSYRSRISHRTVDRVVNTLVRMKICQLLRRLRRAMAPMARPR